MAITVNTVGFIIQKKQRPYIVVIVIYEFRDIYASINGLYFSLRKRP